MRVVMNRVNRLVHETTDGERFITCFYGLIDPENKRLLYISAGHNPPLLLRADGTSETLLSVPKYEFNWQITYELAKPKLLPAGTELEVIAHYDNSANNRFNPDPSKDVRWGDQTWEEMMIGFYGTVVER